MRDYQKPFEGKPDLEDVEIRKVANKGELSLEEKHPADPLKDEVTMMMSHRGGLASPRTEHY